MRSELKASFRKKKSFTPGDHFRNGKSATGRHLLSKLNPNPNADEKHSSGMEDLQKSSLDGKRNQIVIITLFEICFNFFSNILNLHACVLVNKDLPDAGERAHHFQFWTCSLPFPLRSLKHKTIFLFAFIPSSLFPVPTKKELFHQDSWAT